MTKTLVILLSLTTALLLSGCASRYATMSKYYPQCGYRTADFFDFSQCIRDNNPLPKSEAGKLNDGKQRKREDPILAYFHQETAQIAASRPTGKVKPKTLKTWNENAFNSFDGVLTQCQMREQQANQTAGAFAAVMLVGAVAIACSNNGGCGGGGGGSNSFTNASGYAGNCPCPYDRDAAGNLCGGRSAWSRAGGAAPACY